MLHYFLLSQHRSINKPKWMITCRSQQMQKKCEKMKQTTNKYQKLQHKAFINISCCIPKKWWMHSLSSNDVPNTLKYYICDTSFTQNNRLKCPFKLYFENLYRIIISAFTRICSFNKNNCFCLKDSVLFCYLCTRDVFVVLHTCKHHNLRSESKIALAEKQPC